jgi:hypothetical protein
MINMTPNYLETFFCFSVLFFVLVRLRVQVFESLVNKDLLKMNDALIQMKKNSLQHYRKLVVSDCGLYVTRFTSLRPFLILEVKN